MSDNFAGVAQVVADDLRFKKRLKIGRKAFASIRSTDTLKSVASTAGVAWGGAAIASSSAVATALFPAAGILGWLGLATAATPVGWVVAAAALTGGAFYAATSYFSAGERFVDEIPKFINTPIDLLGASLFELMGTLAIAVARADGQFDDDERQTILEHFVLDWGYDPAFANAALACLANRPGPEAVTAIACRLADFQAANPDCNSQAMQSELMAFLRELIAADGVISDAETRAVGEIEQALEARRAPGLAQRVTTFPGRD
jgi:uncharacterized membrane protein YebE (DUF533 family)